MTEDELREIEAGYMRATFEDESAECAQNIPALCAEVRRLRTWLAWIHRYADAEAEARCRGTVSREWINTALRGDPAP